MSWEFGGGPWTSQHSVSDTHCQHPWADQGMATGQGQHASSVWMPTRTDAAPVLSVLILFSASVRFTYEPAMYRIQGAYATVQDQRYVQYSTCGVQPGRPTPYSVRISVHTARTALASFASLALLAPLALLAHCRASICHAANPRKGKLANHKISLPLDLWPQAMSLPPAMGTCWAISRARRLPWRSGRKPVFHLPPST